METGAVQNLVITEYNNTDNNITLDYIERDFSNSKLFENTQDLQMSLSRLQIPFESAELIKIDSTNQSDFQITISGNVPSFNDGSQIAVSGSALMPTSDEFSILSPSDFLESLNKTIGQAYSNLAHDLVYNTGGIDLYYSKYITQNQVYNTAGTFERAFNFTGFIPTSNVLAVNLSILSATHVISYPTPPLVCIELTSPNGTKCLIANNLNLNLSTGQTILFSDYSPQFYRTNSDGKPTYSKMNPVQSFSIFNNETTPNGTWLVKIRPAGNNTINMNINVNLEVIVTPNQNNFAFSPTPPFYSLDRSTGFFSMNVPEKFIVSGLKMSSKKLLKRIMTLEKKINTLDDFVSMPITTLSTALDKTISFLADSPKMYLLNEIERILISSPNLNISRDFIDGFVNTNVITDILIDSDQVLSFDLANYTYESADYPLRRYKFNSSTELSKITLQIKLRYRNGVEVPLVLPPNSSLFLTLSFFKVNR